MCAAQQKSTDDFVKLRNIVIETHGTTYDMSKIKTAQQQSWGTPHRYRENKRHCKDCPYTQPSQWRRHAQASQARWSKSETQVPSQE
jgi:hypothetical protein